MNDIVPSLLEAIQSQFQEELKSNDKIKEILLKQKKGLVDYTDSLSFAKEIGSILSDAISSNIKSETLPNERMYFNIAQRILEPTLKENFDIISAQCEKTQNILNKKANIGLKAIKPEYNQEKTQGIIDYISNRKNYSEVEKSFLETIRTNAKSIVDDSVKANAEFHQNAGLSPKIIRATNGKTCKWCQSLAGVYNYSDVKKTGNIVFRRHANCDCTVVYDPSDGSNKVQNVYSKKIEYRANEEEIKKRIEKIESLDKKDDKIKVEKIKYIESKTIKEAEKFVTETCKIPLCSYKGVSIEVANEMNRSLADALNYTSQIRENMNYYGSYQERNKLLKKDYEEWAKKEIIRLGLNPKYADEEAKKRARKFVGKINENVMAVATSAKNIDDEELREIVSKYSGIAVNTSYGKDYNSFSNTVKWNVKIKWHPKGTENVRAIFDHEFGHQIDYAFGIRENEKVKELFKKYTKEELKENLSEYATTNIAEFIAEAYSEYKNSDKPREIAKAIGKIIEGSVKK